MCEWMDGRNKAYNISNISLSHFKSSSNVDGGECKIASKWALNSSYWNLFLNKHDTNVCLVDEGEEVDSKDDNIK